MNKNEIEILIPTFNEEGNIEQVIKDLNLEGFNNITLLDANSVDATVSIAKKYNCKILLDDKSIKGFGGSIINGLNKLESKYFCIFDGDNSFDPKGINFMMNEMENGYEFVFGTRYMNGAKSDDDTLLSKFANYFFSKIVRILFKINTTDALFFFILGKKENVDKLELKQQDFTICTEFLIKSYKNFKCKEILSKERKRLSGVSKVNKVFEGIKILGNILKLYFS
mgnify:CR=1 FL=1|tara:strand:+ start:466 stop:1140 length:675 start_codon:yes stop_codon:yes gene_type:complete